MVLLSAGHGRRLAGQAGAAEQPDHRHRLQAAVAGAEAAEPEYRYRRAEDRLVRSAGRHHRLNPEWDDTLDTGDVFTVEPGLYGPELRAGLRIEEMYYLTESGLQKLTTFPTDLA